MRRRLLQLGWILAPLAAWLSGCQHAPSTIPADPLLVSKKPVLSRPELKPPATVATLEPEVPCGSVQATAEQRPNPVVPAEDVVPVGFTVRGHRAD